MNDYLIKNGTLVNEDKIFKSDILIKGDIIVKIKKEINEKAKTIINAKGKYVFPGMIDDQVHFREPGFTNKADIYTESKAAAAGGITSYMEMPNTYPQTLTLNLLKKKFDIAAEKSLVNYSFYLGASNDNINEIKKINPKQVCGIKVFMGSSTGNMLVDNKYTLEKIFAESPVIITTHCEDETIIRKNLAYYKKIYGNNIPFDLHPIIRSSEACYKSSSFAVELANKYNADLHVLHLSTKEECSLFNQGDLKEKKITAETCIHHLWFNDNNYKEKKQWIKWNPAIKTEKDRLSLIEALKNNKIDIIATDHAPHTIEEKENVYTQCPSGGPLVQHGLYALFELYKKGVLTLEFIAKKTAHNPAIRFKIKKRGFLKENFKADLFIVDFNKKFIVTKNNILYKCKWSPFEGTTFNSLITQTFVNGNLVYDNGTFNEEKKGEALLFER